MNQTSVRTWASLVLGLSCLATLGACSLVASEGTGEISSELVPTDVAKCPAEQLETLSRACAVGLSQTAISASAPSAADPLLVDERQSYQVRLPAGGAGNAGAVRFVANRSGTHTVYLGTTYAPVTFSDEGLGEVTPTCARSLSPAYTTQVIGQSCADLKVAYAIEMVAGHSYRIALGPLTPQYSVGLRIEPPLDPGLTAADYASAMAVCKSVSDEGCALAETESIPVSSSAVITSRHIYGVDLAPVGGSNRAFVSFTAPYTDDFDVYLGSPTVPFAISDAGARLTPACGGGLWQSDHQQLGCAALRVVHQVHLQGGRLYQLELGPTSSSSWVRLFVTPHSPDSDGDGVADPFDGCPTDPNKLVPGACGCGVAEGSCQVGFPTLAAGGSSVCAILGNGQLKCWGANNIATLGLGDTTARGGSPATIGANLPAVDLGTGRHATALTVNSTDTCALLDNGTGKCWGQSFAYGSYATVGDMPGEMGDNLPPIFGNGVRLTSLGTGFEHTCAVRAGDLYCWGLNGAGQLGRPTSQNPAPLVPSWPRVELGVGQTAVSAVGGFTHTCAVLGSGQVKCWGSNYDGELGLGDRRFRGFDPADMGDALPALNLGQSAKAVVAGYNYGCALLVDGVVKCWGLNRQGILGQGDTKNRGDNAGEVLRKVNLGTGRTVLALAGGFTHACALLDTHQVKCWGDNFSGALGLGDTNHRGDQPGEMGDALPTVDLGIGLSAVSIAAGYGYSCAVLNDASIKCWGDGSAGQKANGDTVSHGDQPGEMGEQLPRAVLE